MAIQFESIFRLLCRVLNNLLFYHMDYGLLNFEKDNDHRTFEIKPTDHIRFTAENF